MRFVIFKRGGFHFAVNLALVERIEEYNGGEDKLKNVPIATPKFSIILSSGSKIHAESIPGTADTETVMEVASYIIETAKFVVGAIEWRGNPIPVVE